MTWSRRDLLGAGSIALGAGLAGCIGERQRHTSLGVSIRDSFGSEPPITLPLAVEAFVANTRKDVAMRGVELVLCDEGRTPVATRRLGDLSWREAPSDRQEVDEGDAMFESAWYSAGWTREHTVEVDVVPEWITFAVDRVWFGDDEESDGLIVGDARASQPVPEFEASILRWDGERPPPQTVTSEAYRFRTVYGRDGVGDDGPLLPDPTPTPTPARSDETEPNGTATGGTGPDGNHTTAESGTPDGDG